MSRLFGRLVNKRIQKTILGQTLTSDSGTAGSGSYALGKVHDGIRDDKRKSDVRLITTSMQHLIDVMLELNYKTLAGQEAKFIMEDARGLSTDRAERDKILIDAGAIELTEEYLLERYDFDTGDFIIPEKSENNDMPGLFSFAKGNAKFTEDQQNIEDLVDDMPIKSPIDPRAIESAIRAATSPEDLEQRLAVVMDGADLETFTLMMEKSLFAADVMGFAHAE